eukprot:scaffold8747_cov96-Cylindrotheca_fusiformis.AAC.6
MKLISTLTIVAASATASCSAFTVVPNQNSALSTSTQVSMGLFDFFSDEARQKRELKKKREIEEQELLQKAIIERRRNPDLMEEYEANVQYRRELKMMGEFDEAKKVDVWSNVEDKTLLDGTSSSKKEVPSEE